MIGFVFEPAKLVDVDLDSGHVHAVRFGVRPTHSIKSVAYTALGVLFAAMAIGSLVLTLGDPTSDAVIGTVVLIVFAGAFLLGGLAAIRMSRRGLGIDLTPTGVAVGLGGDRGEAREDFEWDHVTGIAAVSEPKVIEISTRDGKVLTVPHAKLMSNPDVVAAALHHYRDNPDHRAELAGSEAVDRINNDLAA